MICRYSNMSSGFITEAEIEERRRVRQAEWEKVRQPGQPLGQLHFISSFL